MSNSQAINSSIPLARIFEKNIESRLLLLIFLGIVGVEIIHFAFLTIRPPVFLDEPWISNIAWTWLTIGVPFDSIHAGTLDRFGSGWLRNPYLGTLPWVASFALFGLGIFQARLVSYIFGLLLLAGFYFAGRQAYGRLTGALAALFLSLSQPFLLSSHWTRTDIIVAGIVVTAFGLTLYAFKHERWWAHLLTGLLLGFSLDIHQNGALFIPGIALLYLYHYRGSLLKKRGTWLVAAGGLLGITYYLLVHVLPAPATFQAYYSFEISGRHTIPITNPTPLNLLRSLDDVIGLFHLFENGLDFALIGVGVLYLIYRRQKNDRLLLIYAVSAVLFFTLFQGAKPNQYAILLYPFFLLPVAALFTALFRLISQKSELRFIVTGLVLFYILNGGIHLIRPFLEARDYDYEKMVADVAAAAPGTGKVMGDPLWWFGFTDREFISSRNLVYTHFYDDISYSQALENERPDFLIIDNHDNMIWLQWEIQDVIEARGTMLYDLLTSDYGQVTVYALEWDDQAD